MVFSWLQNLKRGLIKGSVRNRSSQFRRGVRIVGQNSAPATIEMLERRLMLTNATPVIAITTAIFSVNQGSSADFGGIAFSDDSGGNNEQVTLSVAHGTLLIDTTVSGGITGAQITGNGTSTVTITAPLAAINNTTQPYPFGHIKYTPNINFSSSETLTVTINDLGNTGGNQLTATKTKNIGVVPVTQPPVGTSNTVASLENSSYTFTAADFGYTDPNNSPAYNFTNVKITTLTNGSGTLTKNNVAVHAGDFISVADITAGKLVYTPNAFGYGANYASFTFQVQSDGNTNFGASNLDTTPRLMTINVTQVNQAPTITAPSTASTNSNVPLVVSGITFTDIDSGGLDETYTFSVAHGILGLNTSVLGGITAGQVTNNNSGSLTVTATLAQINATLADAAGLVYTPTSQYFGPDTLSLGINDGGHTGVGGVKTATASVALTVVQVNQAPSITAPSSGSLFENDSLIVTGIQFADSDSNGLDEVYTLSVAHGTLSLLTGVSGGVSSGQIVGNNSGSLTITATLAQINATLAAVGGLTYTPTAQYFGSDSLALAINDQGHTGTGGAKTASTSISLTVEEVVPILAGIEGSTLVHSGSGPVPVTSTLTVSEANNTLITGATVQISAGYASGVDQLLFTNTGSIVGSWDSSTGTLTLSGSDTQANYQAALRSIQFQHAGTDTSARTVSFSITDGLKTSNIVSRDVDAVPRVLSITPVADPITGSTATYNVVFSEPVTGVDPSSFTLSGDGVTGGTIGVTGSGASYTVTVTGLLGSGTLGLNLTGTASVLDAGGNAIASSYTGTRLTKFDVGQGVQLTGSALSVVGTAGSDVITVAEDATTLTVTINGIVYSYSAALVSAITISSGAGNDQTTVYSLQSGTQFTSYSGSGTCVVDCSAVSVPVTLNAGTGNATLIGGSGDDRLIGGSGNDTIYGNGGNDTIFGKQGTNYLDGGDGNDTYILSQRSGSTTDVDTLRDSSGSDRINFDFTNDLSFSLSAAAGPQVADASTGYKIDASGNTFETLVLGSGNNVVTGNSTLGTTIFAGAGNNTLTGGAGDDRLYGSSGNDNLYGNGGNDTISGGLGTNYMDGGDGNDTLILTQRSGTTTDVDTLRDSSGSDRLSFEFTNGLSFSLSAAAGPQVADASTGYRIDASGNTFETVILGSGNNVVTGNSTLGTIIYAGTGNNTLTGGAGDDRLIGSSGNDTLYGNGGNDVLSGGTGTNYLDGGDGNDTFNLTQRTGSTTDVDTLRDSSGSDTLQFSTFTQNLAFSLSAAAGPQVAVASTGYKIDASGNTFETVVLGSGTNVVTGNSTLGTTLFAGSGSNTLIGGAGDDRLYGSSGNDHLYGNGGNDTISGGLGTNYLDGGDGNDTLVLTQRSGTTTNVDTLRDSSGSDRVTFDFTHDLAFSLSAAAGPQVADASTGYRIDVSGNTFETLVLGSGNNVVTGNSTLGTIIYAGTGNNTLIGGAGDDRLIGSSGNDTLYGNGGNDTIFGGLGTNYLDGGDGNDTFVLTQRTGSTSDVDTLRDSSGADALQFTSFTHDMAFSLSAAAGPQVADASTGYRIDVAGNTFETVSLGSGNNIVTGNSTLASRIFGGSGSNILIGGSGADLLVGGSGRDILIGGGGADQLTGNDGDDILIEGSTSLSGNQAALIAIRNEWTSANDYATRVGHLRGTLAGGLNTTAGGASGNYFLDNTTVSLDAVKNTLTGSAGNDWFWANALSTKDQTGGELNG
ncbi:beta strand repeat-containing protein [Schlesneria paludicola]|uniref:beta strand repeat-containing protein n=1 Tax=Schlesneria paludicola TaxID=360056 RepID=UPI0002E618FB|nr:calcium-binding protein [Schlesneria paludicola]